MNLPHGFLQFNFNPFAIICVCLTDNAIEMADAGSTSTYGHRNANASAVFRICPGMIRDGECQPARWCGVKMQRDDPPIKRLRNAFGRNYTKATDSLFANKLA